MSSLKIESAATSEKIVAGGRALQNVDIVFGGQFDHEPGTGFVE